ILDERHPRALGAPTREVWPEIYDRLGPLNDAILRGERSPFFAEDHPWLIKRHGIAEEARFTVSYSPIPDPQAANGIGGILTTVVETTQRVRNEDVLRTLTGRREVAVEQRTRERDRIWQVSEDLLGVLTFDGKFTSINPAWSNLLGWSESEILAMPVTELRHPDDAAAAADAGAQLLQGVPSVRVENRLRHRDGSWCWIDWKLTADDGLIYVAGRNVTAQKEAIEALRRSEQQFRSLVGGLTDYALIMLDPNGRIVSWNAGAQRIKGYTADEIVGRHISTFYTPRDRAAGVAEHAL